MPKSNTRDLRETSGLELVVVITDQACSRQGLAVTAM